MDEIDDLMVQLGITTNRAVLGDQVMFMALRGMVDEGEQLVRDRLIAEQNRRSGTRDSLDDETLGEILQVHRTTVSGWLGKIRSRDGALTIRQLLQLCVALNVEPRMTMPTLDEMLNEFIRCGMNQTNLHSYPNFTPLNRGEYPDCVLNRTHWRKVERLTLNLLREALGRNLA